MKKLLCSAKKLTILLGTVLSFLSCQKSINEMHITQAQIMNDQEIEHVLSQMRAVRESQLPEKGIDMDKVAWPNWASVVVCDLVGGVIGGGLGGAIGAVALGAGCSAAAYGGLYGVAPSSNDYPYQTQSTWPTWVQNSQNPFDHVGENHNEALSFAADSSSSWMTISGANQTTDFPKLLNIVEKEFGIVTPSVSSSDLTIIANYIDDLHNTNLLNEYFNMTTTIENDNFISMDVKYMLDVIIEDIYFEEDPEIMVDILKEHERIITDSSIDAETKDVLAQALSIGRYSIGYWFVY